MCGFTGYFEFNFNHNEAIIKRMTDTLINRGPDSYGIYINQEIGISLGHRRLSIQDLSNNASQPMRSQNKRFIIVFNGEIYNHFDLRNKINKEISYKNWKSTSDTETLLFCIEYYGIYKTLELINGMFAFAILDTFDKKLYLCRDRYGEKPLYYGINNGVLFFGSQPKSFKAHPKWKPQISSEALNEYLVRGFIGKRLSIFKGIYKLMPANYISIDLENINLLNYKTYWKHAKKENDYLDTNKLINQLDEKINDAVKLRTISDRKIGSFLSGGIDSSLITYYLQNQFSDPIDTFTIGFEDLNYDESESAKKISKFLGTNHNEVIFTKDNILSLISKLPQIWDEPFADPSQLPTLLLSENATRHVKVAFSGDGGDELFCGYTRYNQGYDAYNFLKYSPKFLKHFYKEIFKLIRSKKSLSYLRLLPSSIRPNSIVDRSLKFESLLNRDLSEDFYDVINTIFNKNNPILLSDNIGEIKNSISSNSFKNYREYMIEKDIIDYLPNDILTKVDRSSMFNGLEVRVPLLDHELASWARNLPIAFKRYDGKGKWPLRKLLSLKIPKNIFEKPKKGFGIPLEKIISHELKDLVYEKLSSKKIKDQGIFNNSYIQYLLNNHYSGGDKFHNQIWNLLIFQLWFDENF